MKVGTVCYATSRGLGHLARNFYQHGIVTDVLVVEHGRVPTNWDWYPGAPVVPLRGIDHHQDTLRSFCRDKDAMLFFETPFDWGLIGYCRGVGVRTYLVTMYECTPKTHSRPYRYLCPSLLDMQYFPEASTFLPLPVDYLWQLRKRAEHFVHNGGYLGMRGREGTTLLIEALRHIHSPIRLTIRVQENVPPTYQRMLATDTRVEYVAATVPYEDLYAMGDVAVGAQNRNGCSLPLQEARAAGMLVMNSDRFPMNFWLPREPLIPVAEYRKAQIGPAYLEYDEAVVRSEDIALKIDEWYGRDISEYSLSAKVWAAENSWEVLGPKWQEALMA